MRRVYPKVELDRGAKGFHNPPLCVKWKNSYAHLEAGQNDEISYFSDKGDLYVLSTNSRLGYAGLQIISSADGLTVDSLFFQNVEEELPIVHSCKRDFFDYKDTTQLKILVGCL